jgi:hypothetical protein
VKAADAAHSFLCLQRRTSPAEEATHRQESGNDPLHDAFPPLSSSFKCCLPFPIIISLKQRGGEGVPRVLTCATARMPLPLSRRRLSSPLLLFCVVIVFVCSSRVKTTTKRGKKREKEADEHTRRHDVWRGFSAAGCKEAVQKQGTHKKATGAPTRRCLPLNTPPTPSSLLTRQCVQQNQFSFMGGIHSSAPCTASPAS